MAQSPVHGVQGATTTQKETLTPFNIYSLWVKENPNSKADPIIMTAIALAESGGKSSNVNSIGACGLWQIHPYQNGCENPEQNAKMAGAKFQTQGYNAWQSYSECRSGGPNCYKKYLPQVKKSLKNAGVSENVQGTGFLGTGIGPTTAPEASEKFREAAEHAASWAGDLAKVLSFIGSGEGWARIGKVALGGAFIIIALSELSKAGSQSSGPGVASRAVKATPAGGAVGFVKGE